MAETQIEWTDATWNPVACCAIITAGCTNSYAMEMARRLEAMGVAKYAGLTRRSGHRTIWNGVVREDPDSLYIPTNWKKPRKIFVNSMSNLFHEGVSDAFISKVWDVMRRTPHRRRLWPHMRTPVRRKQPYPGRADSRSLAAGHLLPGRRLGAGARPEGVEVCDH